MEKFEICKECGGGEDENDPCICESSKILVKKLERDQCFSSSELERYIRRYYEIEDRFPSVERPL